jgi:DNA-binding response OmpR family regulator
MKMPIYFRSKVQSYSFARSKDPTSTNFSVSVCSLSILYFIFTLYCYNEIVRILVIEDEKDLADAIARGLSRQSYSVDIAYDGLYGLELTGINSYDLLILDLNLPGLDGLEVCRRIRANDSRIGILMLTARAGQDDRVTGLDLGADDYLVKPFHFPELIARVRSILRRTGEVRQIILRVDDLVLDPNSIIVYVRDQPIPLTTKEFAILEYLMTNAGKVVSQEELLEHVWNENANFFTQAIKVHINNLRKKLKEAGKEDCIRTVKGKGYVVGA